MSYRDHLEFENEKLKHRLHRLHRVLQWRRWLSIWPGVLITSLLTIVLFESVVFIPKYVELKNTKQQVEEYRIQNIQLYGELSKMKSDHVRCVSPVAGATCRCELPVGTTIGAMSSWDLLIQRVSVP